MSHPGYIKMMDRHGALLGIHACAEHRCRAEDDTDVTTVHGLYHRLLGFLILAFLDETDLRGRDALVLHELALDLRVHAPFARLVCSEIGEDELRALLLVILSIVLAEQLGTMASFVVDVIRVFHRIDHAHIEAHFAGEICGDKHLGLLLLFAQRGTIQEGGITRFGKLHQLADERLLLGRGWDVMQDLTLLRTVDADVLGRAEIANLPIKQKNRI